MNFRKILEILFAAMLSAAPLMADDDPYQGLMPPPTTKLDEVGVPNAGYFTDTGVVSALGHTDSAATRAGCPSGPVQAYAETNVSDQHLPAGPDSFYVRVYSNVSSFGVNTALLIKGGGGGVIPPFIDSPDGNLVVPIHLEGGIGQAQVNLVFLPTTTAPPPALPSGKILVGVLLTPGCATSGTNVFSKMINRY